MASTSELAGHAEQLAKGDRFAFGANWERFVALLNPVRVSAASESLGSLLGLHTLRGLRFLDMGSGSGLFSLAAAQLGARVVSVDYDPLCVECTGSLRKRFGFCEAEWTVLNGSVLDAQFLAQLGSFDVVYSWGVLHHSGSMWQALENVAGLVADRGSLTISIYNDQGSVSRWWKAVKRAYVSRPSLRPLLASYALAVCWGKTFARDSLRLDPLTTWRQYHAERGMSAWHDLIDWVGGYPFEVAKPEEIFDFYQARGFRLERLITQSRGCNEFRFRKETPRNQPELSLSHSV
jgi:2-polyprenyl-3-methyl-5-hydroxy-6-metoxy-1,4-benzoquinol methylase